MDQEMLNAQIALELSSIDEARDAYEKRLKGAQPLPPHFTLISRGLEPLSREIQSFQNSKVSGRRNGPIRVLLSRVDCQELAFVNLWTAITGLAEESNATKAAVMMGRAVQDHLEYIRFKETCPDFVKALEKNLNTRQIHLRKSAVMKAKRLKGIEDLQWDDETRCHVGAKMLEFLIGATGMYEKVRGKTKDGNNCLMIRPSEATQEFLEKAHADCSLAHPLYKPCIIPPKPWTSLYDGGFHSGIGRMKLSLVKCHHKVVLEELEHTLLWNVYHTVNALQETAWRVNKKLLEVAEHAWAEPDGMGVLPERQHRELPQRPWNSPSELVRLKAEQPEVVRDWNRQASILRSKQERIKPRIKVTSDILARAKEFKDYERFYFCWQVDFRGRCYPVQPYLQPQGNDLCKGLLKFADAVPIGRSGEFWLANQGAKTYGHKLDKAPLKDRFMWAWDYEAEIRDSAENPIDGSRFWTEADDPWQFLAFCFEWTDYFKSGHNEGFLSRIPVAVDGSCNGLQHCAALMRDPVLGRAVNLSPSEKPNDVYGDVARNLAEIVENDLDNHETFKTWTDHEGREVSTKCSDMAAMWHGQIDRGLVKRNVMTLPYGVTPAGMRKQLLDELNKRLDQNPEKLGRLAEVDKTELFRVVAYLADRVQEAIGGVAKSAQEIMVWLQHIASLFNEAGLPMRWTVPTGFHVIQFYLKRKTVGINTYWGKQRVHLALMQETGEFDSQKQLAGAMPNMIHSLDAAHLMMTVNHCKGEGIKSFAMVHDSYGTHAGHMEIMNEALRVAFNRLYSDFSLEELHNQWAGGYRDPSD